MTTFRRVQAGLYQSAEGHQIERMTPETHLDGFSAAAPWRLSKDGQWWGDHATLRDAQASIEEEG